MARRKKSGCHKERVTIKGRHTADGKPVSFMRKSSACAKPKSGWWKSKSASGRAAQKRGLALGRTMLKHARAECRAAGRLHDRPGRGNCVAKTLKRIAR